LVAANAGKAVPLSVNIDWAGLIAAPVFNDLDAFSS
jgi:hypothetical protein